MLKICKGCKIEKPQDEFYWDAGNNHFFARCKKCIVKGMLKSGVWKKWAQSPKGKKSLQEASRRARIKHKEKWIARTKARLAILKGLIIKPKKCEVCKKVKPLQAHHEDYSKPLEVIFLCYSCHAEADRLLSKQVNTKE